MDADNGVVKAWGVGGGRGDRIRVAGVNEGEKINSKQNKN